MKKKLIIISLVLLSGLIIKPVSASTVLTEPGPYDGLQLMYEFFPDYLSAPSEKINWELTFNERGSTAFSVENVFYGSSSLAPGPNSSHILDDTRMVKESQIFDNYTHSTFFITPLAYAPVTYMVGDFFNVTNLYEGNYIYTVISTSASLTPAALGHTFNTYALQTNTAHFYFDQLSGVLLDAIVYDEAETTAYALRLIETKIIDTSTDGTTDDNLDIPGYSIGILFLGTVFAVVLLITKKRS